MRKLFLLFAALAIVSTVSAQEFDNNFQDATLRLDYTFMGNASEQHIGIRELSVTENWWGRRVNMS